MTRAALAAAVALALAVALGACAGDDLPAVPDAGAVPDAPADPCPGCDAAPVDACAAQGVPAEGICAGPAEIARCVDGARVETEACAAGATCHVLAGEATCVGLEACVAVGPLGRCAGDTLWRCDGAVTIADCAATGRTCAFAGDDAGYACVEPSALPAHRVAGVVRWEDRAVSPGALGPPTAAPARGTMIAVVDAGNNLIATGSTADDGSYVLHYAAAAGAQVRVVAYSRSRAAVRPARVRNASGYLHAVGSPSFTAGAAEPVDVLVTAGSGAGAAWNALDAIVTAMDWLRAHGVTTLSPLYLYWQQGTGTGSYYLSASNTIQLASDDGYDDVVILHEVGHYIQDEYSASDNPGGPHDGSPADPRLAWGEGGATWFAIAIREVPYYIDHAAGGGWWVELEQRVHAANPGGAMSQLVSEWMVAELMWDVSDGPLDADGDAMTAGSAADVMAVLLGYLVAPNRADRGRVGVDLVDWLDGWFVHHGLGHCAMMRALVRTHYGFPYDLAGPAGACP